ncbi:MAG TPA: MIP family channel protein [Dehalococcoidia bacterium]|nr:MIP family channel protein [Dehalococcoidia bacterium]
MSQFDLSAHGLGLTAEDLSPNLFRAALAELIGVLLFVFIGCGAVVMFVSGGFDAALVGIALAHGLAIAVLVAGTARISGGHINPAVTFAAVVTGRMKAGPGVVYVAAQLVGAVAGALLLQVVLVDSIEGTLGAHAVNDAAVDGNGAAVLLEVILTFVLVFTVFATAIDTRSTIANVAPLMIGLAILIDHLVAVPLTGASMNPARSFGPALAAGEWDDHWIYWAGPLLGGALAGIVYMLAFWDREGPIAPQTVEHHPGHAEGHPEGHAQA